MDLDTAIKNTRSYTDDANSPPHFWGFDGLGFGIYSTQW